ncbi:host attachment family protein [Rhizobium sp. LjRoot30]|uniref:baeRF12 domain-containing protein n=1 Tax=Rhizobium sp. LjRoot30 TaxID=3342320 RepID=UPI003ED160E5
MDPIRIPWKSWVVVCDGAKALILRNDGDADLINLKVVDTLTQPNDKTSEIGTDRPGRAYSPPGVSRSAMEETDWHAQAEEDFLKEVAGRITDIASKAETQRIVLVAPPTALGILRQSLGPAAGTAITAEIPKDYAQMPVPEIEKNLLRLAA